MVEFAELISSNGDSQSIVKVPFDSEFVEVVGAVVEVEVEVVVEVEIVVVEVEVDDDIWLVVVEESGVFSENIW